MADEVIERTDPRAQLIEALWKDQKARPYLEEAMAQAYPNAEIPGRAARVALTTSLSAIEKKSQELDAKIEKFGVERQHERAVADLISDGFTASQVTEIEKLMTDEGIGTHKAAADVYRARANAGVPRSSVISYDTSALVPGSAAHQSSKFFRGIMADGDQWGRVVSEKIMNDFAADPTGAAKRWNDPNYWPETPHFGPTKDS